MQGVLILFFILSEITKIFTNESLKNLLTRVYYKCYIVYYLKIKGRRIFDIFLGQLIIFEYPGWLLLNI